MASATSRTSRPVALTVARLVNDYDLALQSKDGAKVEHPVPFHQVFTLRIGVDNIGMRFDRREAPQQRLRLAS